MGGFPLDEYVALGRLNDKRSREVTMDDFRSLIFIPALIALTTFATPASAAHVLGGTWSKASIKSHCKAAGGSFNDNGPGQGYGCFATGGQVSCNNKGRCIGTDPSRLVQGNKTGIDPVTVGNRKQ
jgi:hypothetical protein